MEIHCGTPQHLVVKKNEKEYMTLSSACHGDVKCNIISAYICWLLRLLRFISVLVNNHANKSSDYVLEAPDYKQSCVILAAFLFWLVESLSWGKQAITLSTCIVAHNNALFALLVSNNFAEIKGNVFKRFSKDNTHSLAYSG
ncbi:hypothetical protein V6N12_043541 [Hibiscus sabdariffa]|uniref:Uncharacterized protein n=1 Tax=Hibiscus sabdariffa TaxID=183260 RepID=A0ABR2DEM0_9ROSI